MLGAYLAQALQIALRGNHHPSRPAEGLDDDSGNGAGIVQGNHVEQPVRQGAPPFGRQAPMEGTHGGCVWGR